ncbi:uncharacterized protein [Triticum aestivum]|uniref:uncharacterized protein isoform X4 n=1 Tax=Triticum aestivum TaxID=4565 RepID=UPI001D02AD6D|nr:uncharacterized protein LOC123167666 isoform X4 [Triticum aestivum]XP_044441437.1 uncharacterized protein LOC123167666 isoform X4 [Triticum aestivum]XP_044441439.1 uncharacterized protein LOC123167666 isoform X4 [Triticum aestivum]XP_044441440.1 uncharacterized protein LOC123167666 isoform X4 [Triticum aestivum]XP_044441442.1 uncharacterized protein LOC123167666 isoform X4 [Triticum aestivum]XP_044441443.1 uncharacterized protein LOC123167666 isoform X4 [Triticum aestivum]XP_044441444.1 un
MGLCKFIVSHILYVAVFCLAEVVRSRSSERPMQGGPRSEMALLSKCRTISHSPSMMIFWAALLAPHKLFRKLLGSFLQMKMFIQKKIFICAPGHFCKLCSPSAEQFLSEHPSLVRQVKAYLVVCRQRDCTPLLLGCFISTATQGTVFNGHQIAFNSSGICCNLLFVTWCRQRQYLLCTLVCT